VLSIVSTISTTRAAHQQGLSALTVFGIIGAVVGIVAAIQQFAAAIHRRRFARAEEKLLEAIEANDKIRVSREQVEHYGGLRSALLEQIKTEVPKRARYAYLTDRLDQLGADLYRTYREYEDVRHQLADQGVSTELDRSISQAIKGTIIPNRRNIESRNLYVLTLLIALIVFNVGPLRLSSYFYVLGYSDQSTGVAIMTTIGLGVICVTLATLVGLSFLSGNARSRIARIRITTLSLLISAAFIGFCLLLWGGFYERALAISYDQFGESYYSPVGGEDTTAGFCFNMSVIILAVSLSVFIFSWQRGRIARHEQSAGPDGPASQGVAHG
jgi:hypothetical protein